MHSIPFKRPYAQLGVLVLAALLIANAAASSRASFSTPAAGNTNLRWELAAASQPGRPDATPTWSAGTRPAEALAALQARAAGPLEAHWAGNRIPDWLTASAPEGRIPYTPSAAEIGNPVAIARGFLDENRALFGLRSAADELAPVRSDPDMQLNFASVRLGQVYRSIPVFGKQLIVNMDPQQRIVAVSGQFAPGINIATEPTLSAARAEGLAARDLLANQLEPAEAARAKPDVLKNKTRLVIYVDDAGKPTLTWQVKIMTWSPLGEWLFFVNARRPAVVKALDSSDRAMRRQTYTAGDSTDIPGNLLIDEGERSRDPIAQAAHDNAGKVYQYYFNTFKRDAFDNRGSPMVSTVHFGSDPQDQENAAWVSEYAQMIYGDGGEIFKPLAYGLDVIGHEFTHGVVDNTSQLIYETQSGALSESYADIFGVLISGADWEVGGDVVKSPPYPLPYLRSLKDPNAGGSYDPRNPLGGVGQPANMNEYANLPNSRRSDNGGVHVNSGIPNRAAYLVAQALGKDKMQQIYYRAVTQYLSPDSDFLAAANATARAATDLYGQNEANAVRSAFGQVGITIGGPDTAPTPPPATGQNPAPNAPPPQAPQVPGGCAELVASGDFENAGGWREVTAKGGSSLIDTELPRTGQRSAWLGGTDEESFQYIYQDINIPANATNVKLTYYRLIHRETSGLLGALANEAKFSVMIANTQGDTVQSLEELDSSQGDDRWNQITFDLSRFAGKTARLVFAVETQPSNVSSMFIDDVSVIGCTTGAGPAAPQPSSQDQVYIQGTIDDADTGRGVNGAQVFIIKPGLSASDAASDDNLTSDEVLTMGTADRNGVYQSEQPIPRGQVYSAIVLGQGYRAIIADEEVDVPSDAENPFPVDATLRRGR